MQAMTEAFASRDEAGRLLAARLARYAGRDDTIVLGIPRGGMPVAYEVALALDAPLDVCVARRIPVPGHKELTLGAVAPGGVTILNQAMVQELQAPGKVIESLVAAEREIMMRREEAYRAGRAAPDLAGKTVLLVDDRLETGATLQAAAASVRAQRPSEIIAAIPVAAPEACWAVRYDVDAIFYAVSPASYRSIPWWYRDFPASSDEEVRQMMDRCAAAPRPRHFAERSEGQV